MLPSSYQYDEIIQQQSEWFQLKLVELLQRVASTLIKEIHITQNDIELKTTTENIEALL